MLANRTSAQTYQKIEALIAYINNAKNEDSHSVQVRNERGVRSAGA